LIKSIAPAFINTISTAALESITQIIDLDLRVSIQPAKENHLLILAVLQAIFEAKLVFGFFVVPVLREQFLATLLFAARRSFALFEQVYSACYKYHRGTL